MILRVLTVLLLCVPVFALAQSDDRLVRVHAPDVLVESGVLKFILPRFSLKTQVRVELVGDADNADLSFGQVGRALFQGLDQTWHVDVRRSDHPGTDKLAAWLLSETGLRTISSYAPEGEPIFGPPEETGRRVVAVAPDGNVELGHDVSRAKCTRCHAVDDATRGWGIGSAPSFGVLRALADWEQRFAAFYVLNPHPSFTQILELTPPFPIDRPSPIAPVEMDLDELEAILAYVAAMPAADLGKPIDHQ